MKAAASRPQSKALHALGKSTSTPTAGSRAFLNARAFKLAAHRYLLANEYLGASSLGIRIHNMFACRAF